MTKGGGGDYLRNGHKGKLHQELELSSLKPHYEFGSPKRENVSNPYFFFNLLTSVPNKSVTNQ